MLAGQEAGRVILQCGSTYLYPPPKLSLFSPSSSLVLLPYFPSCFSPIASTIFPATIFPRSSVELQTGYQRSEVSSEKFTSRVKGRSTPTEFLTTNFRALYLGYSTTILFSPVLTLLHLLWTTFVSVGQFNFLRIDEIRISTMYKSDSSKLVSVVTKSPSYARRFSFRRVSLFFFPLLHRGCIRSRLNHPANAMKATRKLEKDAVGNSTG